MNDIRRLRLEAALRAAGDESTRPYALTQMLDHLDVWETVAARRRLPRGLRNRLHSTALMGPGDGAREDETQSAFRLRWALTVLSVSWMTPLRLQALARPLYSIIRNARDENAASLCRAIAQHPHATAALLGDCLERPDPHGYDRVARVPQAVREALAQLENPWSTFAKILQLRSGSGQEAPSCLLGAPLKEIGAGLDGLDETSASVLVGLLPSWTDTFEAAVTSARDVAGNPDPASVAEHFPYFSRRDEDALARALSWAAGAGTSTAQLRLLPLHDLAVWRTVADRDDLTSDLRRELVKVASEGISRMTGLPSGSRADMANAWARDVLGVSWLTSTRLTKLGQAAAGCGTDPALLMSVLTQHPNVTVNTITTAISAVRADIAPPFGGRWLLAVAALAEQPGPVWGPLAWVLEQAMTPRRTELPWRWDLGHLPNLGRRLDALRLRPAELVALLELLPSWAGDLPNAVSHVKVTFEEAEAMER